LALSGEDQGYKPMVKSFGGQWESEGVVVPLIGVQHNASGGKGWRGTTFVDSHRSGMIVYEGKVSYGFDAPEVHS
jgi:hypothetical protein